MHRLNLVGFDDFEAGIIEEVKEKMRPLITKYDKMFGNETIKEFKVAVKTTKKDGGKNLQEMTIGLSTTLGNFRAKKSGWDILSLVDEVEAVLERQIKEKKEKMLTEREKRSFKF